MPYATLRNLKDYLMAGGQVPPTTDDALLAAMLTRAQAIIEAKTTRVFESRTETREYDMPPGRRLELDDDLLTVTTLTNGDGAVIASSEYYLWPLNYAPKRAITLRQGSAVSWQPGTNGDTENVISVAGTWGFMAAADDDIVQITLRLATWLYRQKDSSQDLDRPLIGPGGTMIMPSKFPNDVAEILYLYTPRQ